MSTRLSRSTLQLATLALSALAGALSVGCATDHKYSFAVSLKNESHEPVTVWLTKNGPPEEPEWLSPEALSNSRAASIGAINGVVIPPGKTAEMPPLAGRFAPDTLAILRVYAGQLTLDQMLATPPDGKLRVDVPLREGMNHLAVSPTLPLRVDEVDAPKR